VQTVRPGIVLRVHVLPPSSEEATRSLRADAGPTSCFQVATRLRGLSGLTVIAGSSSWSVMVVSSKRAPGQPAAKGLGPEITRRSLTLYGSASLAAASDVFASSATATAKRNLTLIIHLPARPLRACGRFRLVAWAAAIVGFGVRYR